MRDLYSNITALSALPSASRSAADSGQAIDLKDARKIVFVPSGLYENHCPTWHESCIRRRSVPIPCSFANQLRVGVCPVFYRIVYQQDMGPTACDSCTNTRRDVRAPLIGVPAIGRLRILSQRDALEDVPDVSRPNDVANVSAEV